MQTKLGLLGSLVFASVSVAVFQTGCEGSHVSPPLTGRLELSITPTADAAAGSDLISLPSTAASLTIASTGWKVSNVYVGRCEGTCDDAPVDAWLSPRPDALYGVGYGCPEHEGCVDHPDQWGFETMTYGVCPPNTTSKLTPVTVEAGYGTVDDIYTSTDCSAQAPVLEEGTTFYVAAVGLSCANDDNDECDEIDAVRFFRLEHGALVDAGGSTDDRRPVDFSANPFPSIDPEE